MKYLRFRQTVQGQPQELLALLGCLVGAMTHKTGVVVACLSAWSLIIFLSAQTRTNHPRSTVMLSSDGRKSGMLRKIQSLEQLSQEKDSSANRPEYVAGGDPLTGGTSW